MFEVISILWGNFVELTEPIWKPIAGIFKWEPKPSEEKDPEYNNTFTFKVNYKIADPKTNPVTEAKVYSPYDFLEEGKNYEPKNFSFHTHHHMMDLYSNGYDILYTKPTAEDFVRIFNTKMWYIKDNQPHSLFIENCFSHTGEVHANLFVINNEGFRFSDEKEFNKVCKFIEDITDRNMIPNNVDDQRHHLITRDRPIFKD